MAHDLIASLYDSVLHPERIGVVIAGLARQIGAASGYLYTGGSAGEFLVEGEHNIDPGFKQAYAQRYWRLNPFLPVAQMLQPGQIRGQPEITTTIQYKRSEFFNDWVRPQGWQQPSAVGLRNEGGELSFLGFWHGGSKGVLRARDIALLDELAPHLQRMSAARELVRRSLQTTASLGQSLAMAGFAVVLVEAQGRIAYANPAAETLLRAGGTVRQAGGRLVAQLPDRQDRLREAIRKATHVNPAERQGGVILVPRDGAQRPLTLHVLPMTAPDAGIAAGIERPLAVLFLFDPEQDISLRLAAFQGNFGLTCAETRLLGQMVRGQTLVEAAHALKLSEATARTQVSRIFARTEAIRQPELIRLFFQGTLPGMAALPPASRP